MTPEQEHIFCKAAALGIACGLKHRYEWYVNAVRALTHTDYSTIPENARNLTQAFMAFEKTTASSEHEEEDLRNMEEAQFSTKIHNWYNRG